MEGSANLLKLPQDLLERVLDLSNAPALHVLCRTCHSLRAISCADALWQRHFEQHFAQVVQHLYGGTVPLPREGVSWKTHYLMFDMDWLQNAAADTGSILITISGSLYNVTEFLFDHPGDPKLLVSAAGRDATEAFEYTGHSKHARRTLAAFAVPELQLVPLFMRPVTAEAEPSDSDSSQSGWGLRSMAARMRGLLAITGSWRNLEAVSMLRPVGSKVPDELEDVTDHLVKDAKRALAKAGRSL